MGPVEGYSLGADRVEVRTQAHWQAWDFPGDMVAITPSGSMQSRFVQVPHNAILNVADFSYPIDGSLRDQYANSFQDENNTLLAHGGIKRAGSNPQLAERAIDADPTTAWEPDPADPLRDWVLEIDLGRLVSATKVVVRFAEEGTRSCNSGCIRQGGKTPLARLTAAVPWTIPWLAVPLSPIATSGSLSLISHRWAPIQRSGAAHYAVPARRGHGHQWRAGATALCRGLSGVDSREPRALWNTSGKLPVKSV